MLHGLHNSYDQRWDGVPMKVAFELGLYKGENLSNFPHIYHFYTLLGNKIYLIAFN